MTNDNPLTLTPRAEGRSGRKNETHPLVFLPLDYTTRMHMHLPRARIRLTCALGLGTCVVLRSITCVGLNKGLQTGVKPADILQEQTRPRAPTCDVHTERPMLAQHVAKRRDKTDSGHTARGLGAWPCTVMAVVR